VSRLAIVIIVILGLLLAAALSCVGAGWYFVTVTASPPEKIAYALVVPGEVSLGEKFQIDVVVTNHDSRPRTLVGVDVYPPFTEGVAVRAASPPWESEDSTLMLSLLYELSLQPGETRTITLACEGLQPGTWEGDIDVCIDSQFSILSRSGRVVVRDAAPTSP